MSTDELKSVLAKELVDAENRVVGIHEREKTQREDADKKEAAEKAVDRAWSRRVAKTTIGASVRHARGGAVCRSSTEIDSKAAFPLVVRKHNDRVFAVNEIFVANPEYRPYFYDKKMPTLR